MGSSRFGAWLLAGLGLVYAWHGAWPFAIACFVPLAAVLLARGFRDAAPAAPRRPEGRDVLRFVQYAVAGAGVLLVSYLRYESKHGLAGDVERPWRLFALVGFLLFAVWSVGPHPRLARRLRRAGRRLGVR